jgi:hypothetical protein
MKQRAEDEAEGGGWRRVRRMKERRRMKQREKYGAQGGG